MNDLEQTNMLQPLVDEIETAVSNAKKEIAEKSKQCNYRDVLENRKIYC